MAACQDKVIEYLRGDRSNEGEDDGQFRVRPSPLGDIANSQPVVVGDPEWAYLEGNDPGYTAFKAAMAGRAKLEGAFSVRELEDAVRGVLP